MTQPPEYLQIEGWNLRLQKIRARFDFCLLCKNLCAEHIVSYNFINVNRDFCLQIGIFIYKTGKLITKREFYLQNGIFALQTGLSFCNLPSGEIFVKSKYDKILRQKSSKVIIYKSKSLKYNRYCRITVIRQK